MSSHVTVSIRFSVLNIWLVLLFQHIHVLLVNHLLFLKHQLGQLPSGGQPLGPPLQAALVHALWSGRLADEVLVAVLQLGLDGTEHVQFLVLHKHVIQISHLLVIGGQNLSSSNVVRVVEATVFIGVGIVMADLAVDLYGRRIWFPIVDQVRFVLPEPNWEEHLPVLNGVHSDAVEIVSGQLHSHSTHEHQSVLRKFLSDFIHDGELGEIRRIAVKWRP